MWLDMICQVSMVFKLVCVGWILSSCLSQAFVFYSPRHRLRIHANVMSQMSYHVSVKEKSGICLYRIQYDILLYYIIFVYQMF